MKLASEAVQGKANVINPIKRVLFMDEANEMESENGPAEG